MAREHEYISCRVDSRWQALAALVEVRARLFPRAVLVEAAKEKVQYGRRE